MNSSFSVEDDDCSSQFDEDDFDETNDTACSVSSSSSVVLVLPEDADGTSFDGSEGEKPADQYVPFVVGNVPLFLSAGDDGKPVYCRQYPSVEATMASPDNSGFDFNFGGFSDNSGSTFEGFGAEMFEGFVEDSCDSDESQFDGFSDDSAESLIGKYKIDYLKEWQNKSRSVDLDFDSFFEDSNSSFLEAQPSTSKGARPKSKIKTSHSFKKKRHRPNLKKYTATSSNSSEHKPGTGRPRFISKKRSASLDDSICESIRNLRKRRRLSSPSKLKQEYSRSKSDNSVTLDDSLYEGKRNQRGTLSSIAENRRHARNTHTVRSESVENTKQRTERVYLSPTKDEIEIKEENNDGINYNEYIGEYCNRVGCTISWLESMTTIIVNVTNGIVYELDEFAKKINWERVHVAKWILRMRGILNNVPTEGDMNKIHIILKRRKALTVTLAGNKRGYLKMQEFDTTEFTMPSDIKTEIEEVIIPDNYTEDSSWNVENITDSDLSQEIIDVETNPVVDTVLKGNGIFGVKKSGKLCKPSASMDSKKMRMVSEDAPKSVPTKVHTKTRRFSSDDSKSGPVKFNEKMRRVSDDTGTHKLLPVKLKPNMHKKKMSKDSQSSVPYWDILYQSNIPYSDVYPYFKETGVSLGKFCDAAGLTIDDLNSRDNKDIHVTQGMVIELYHFYRLQDCTFKSLVEKLLQFNKLCCATITAMIVKVTWLLRSKRRDDEFMNAEFQYPQGKRRVKLEEPPEKSRPAQLSEMRSSCRLSLEKKADDSISNDLLSGRIREKKLAGNSVPVSNFNAHEKIRQLNISILNQKKELRQSSRVFIDKSTDENMSIDPVYARTSEKKISNDGISKFDAHKYREKLDSPDQKEELRKRTSRRIRLSVDKHTDNSMSDDLVSGGITEKKISEDRISKSSFYEQKGKVENVNQKGELNVLDQKERKMYVQAEKGINCGQKQTRKSSLENKKRKESKAGVVENSKTKRTELDSENIDAENCDQRQTRKSSLKHKKSKESKGGVVENSKTINVENTVLGSEKIDAENCDQKQTRTLSLKNKKSKESKGGGVENNKTINVENTVLGTGRPSEKIDAENSDQKQARKLSLENQKRKERKEGGVENSKTINVENTVLGSEKIDTENCDQKQTRKLSLENQKRKERKGGGVENGKTFNVENTVRSSEKIDNENCDQKQARKLSLKNQNRTSDVQNSKPIVQTSNNIDVQNSEKTDAENRKKNDDKNCKNGVDHIKRDTTINRREVSIEKLDNQKDKVAYVTENDVSIFEGQKPKGKLKDEKKKLKLNRSIEREEAKLDSLKGKNQIDPQNNEGNIDNLSKPESGNTEIENRKAEIEGLNETVDVQKENEPLDIQDKGNLDPNEDNKGKCNTHTEKTKLDLQNKSDGSVQNESEQPDSEYENFDIDFSDLSETEDMGFSDENEEDFRDENDDDEYEIESKNTDLEEGKGKINAQDENGKPKAKSEKGKSKCKKENGKVEQYGTIEKGKYFEQKGSAVANTCRDKEKFDDKNGSKACGRFGKEKVTFDIQNRNQNKDMPKVSAKEKLSGGDQSEINKEDNVDFQKNSKFVADNKKDTDVSESDIKIKTLINENVNSTNDTRKSDDTQDMKIRKSARDRTLSERILQYQRCSDFFDDETPIEDFEGRPTEKHSNARPTGTAIKNGLDKAEKPDDSPIKEKAEKSDDSLIKEKAEKSDDALIKEKAEKSDDSLIKEKTEKSDDSPIKEKAEKPDDSNIKTRPKKPGNSSIKDEPLRSLGKGIPRRYCSPDSRVIFRNVESRVIPEFLEKDYFLGEYCRDAGLTVEDLNTTDAKDVFLTKGAVVELYYFYTERGCTVTSLADRLLRLKKIWLNSILTLVGRFKKLCAGKNDVKKMEEEFLFPPGEHNVVKRTPSRAYPKSPYEEATKRRPKRIIAEANRKRKRADEYTCELIIADESKKSKRKKKSTNSTNDMGTSGQKNKNSYVNKKMTGEESDTYNDIESKGQTNDGSLDKVSDDVVIDKEVEKAKGREGSVTRADIVLLYAEWLKNKNKVGSNVFVTDLLQDVVKLMEERKVQMIRIPAGTLMSSSVKLYEEYRRMWDTSKGDALMYLEEDWLEDIQYLVSITQTSRRNTIDGESSSKNVGDRVVHNVGVSAVVTESLQDEEEDFSDLSSERSLQIDESYVSDDPDFSDFSESKPSSAVSNDPALRDFIKSKPKDVKKKEEKTTGECSKSKDIKNKENTAGEGSEPKNIESKEKTTRKGNKPKDVKKDVEKPFGKGTDGKPKDVEKDAEKPSGKGTDGKLKDVEKDAEKASGKGTDGKPKDVEKDAEKPSGKGTNGKPKDVEKDAEKASIKGTDGKPKGVKKDAKKLLEKGTGTDDNPKDEEKPSEKRKCRSFLDLNLFFSENCKSKLEDVNSDIEDVKSEKEKPTGKGTDKKRKLSNASDDGKQSNSPAGLNESSPTAKSDSRIESAESYEIEKIIDYKCTLDENLRKQMSYLIRWKGYEPEKDSWINEEDLQCRQTVDTIRSGNMSSNKKIQGILKWQPLSQYQKDDFSKKLDALESVKDLPDAVNAPVTIDCSSGEETNDKENSPHTVGAESKVKKGLQYITNGELLQLYDNWRQENQNTTLISEKSSSIDMKPFIEKVERLMTAYNIKTIYSDFLLQACFVLTLMRRMISSEEALKEFLDKDCIPVLEASRSNQVSHRENSYYKLRESGKFGILEANFKKLQEEFTECKDIRSVNRLRLGVIEDEVECLEKSWSRAQGKPQLISAALYQEIGKVNKNLDKLNGEHNTAENTENLQSVKKYRLDNPEKYDNTCSDLVKCGVSKNSVETVMDSVLKMVEGLSSNVQESSG